MSKLRMIEWASGGPPYELCHHCNRLTTHVAIMRAVTHHERDKIQNGQYAEAHYCVECLELALRRLRDFIAS